MRLVTVKMLLGPNKVYTNRDNQEKTLIKAQSHDPVTISG